MLSNVLLCGCSEFAGCSDHADKDLGVPRTRSQATPALEAAPATSRLHLKSPPASPYQKTLCGRADSGTLYYAEAENAKQIATLATETQNEPYPLCLACGTVFSERDMINPSAVDASK